MQRQTRQDQPLQLEFRFGGEAFASPKGRRLRADNQDDPFSWNHPRRGFDNVPRREPTKFRSGLSIADAIARSPAYGEPASE